MRNKPSFDDVVRALVILLALLAVGWLAIFGGAQIAPLAAGGLLTLLAAGTGYLFRGRVQGALEPPTLLAPLPRPTLPNPSQGLKTGKPGPPPR